MKRILRIAAQALVLVGLVAWVAYAAPPQAPAALVGMDQAPEQLGGSHGCHGCCTPVVIGIAEPETDGTALGWDVTPAPGNWGGRGADGSFAVAWENDQPDVPDLPGRFADVTVDGANGYVPTKIEVGYLAGVANDDFCVLVQQFRCSGSTTPRTYVAIDCINEDEYNTTEVWSNAFFPLPRNVFAAGQDMTVQIRVTGNAWSGKATWGQLGVDYIKVWGVRRGCAWPNP